MTLSERIAAGEVSAELDVAIARVMGWEISYTPPSYSTNIQKQWSNKDGSLSFGCPCYRTDIRLTLAEIERNGWLSSHTATRNDGCESDVFNGEWCKTATRTDRNLTLAALEALLKAMGE
jgi:hypothetical protein